MLDNDFGDFFYNKAFCTTSIKTIKFYHPLMSILPRRLRYSKADSPFQCGMFMNNAHYTVDDSAQGQLIHTWIVDL